LTKQNKQDRCGDHACPSVHLWPSISD